MAKGKLPPSFNSERLANAERLRRDGIKPQGQRPAIRVRGFKRRHGKTLQCTVYLEISLGPQSLDVSTGEVCQWDAFDPKTTTVADAPDQTARLRELVRRIKALAAELQLTGRAIDLVLIRDAVFANETLVLHTPNVAEFIAAYLVREQRRLDLGELSLRTIWKRTRFAGHFRLYAESAYGAKPKLSDLHPANAKGFRLWLREHKNLSANTANEEVAFIKLALVFAVENGWLPTNPFAGFRARMLPVERVTLTNAEMEKFFSLRLESKSLENVRLIFCFLLLTGLSYADAERLQVGHIRTTDDGDKFIEIHRLKTEKVSLTPAQIPLGPLALAILQRFWPDDHSAPILPIQKNQAFNRSIKQIAHMAGVERSVSSKVARNSLATHLANAGVRLDDVASMLGHADPKTTRKYYTKIRPQTVVDAVKDLPHFHSKT